MLRVICVLKIYLNLLFHLPWFLEVDRLLNVFKILHWTRFPFLAAGSSMSLRILKVMDINERENTIDLKFEVIMEWRDYRITYNNLKEVSFLNALTINETQSIWLPIVVYKNTDQEETTRLGWLDGKVFQNLLE